jgi:NMD protein affecting ribosome stability and mRNA decay
MPWYEVTYTHEVSAVDEEYAKYSGRTGVLINTEVVPIKFCPNCGAKWPKVVWVHGRDENGQAHQEERCEACAK